MARVTLAEKVSFKSVTERGGKGYLPMAGALADPAVGFGGRLGEGTQARVGTPKTANSADLGGPLLSQNVWKRSPKSYAKAAAMCCRFLAVDKNPEVMACKRPLRYLLRGF